MSFISITLGPSQYYQNSRNLRLVSLHLHRDGVLQRRGTFRKDRLKTGNHRKRSKRLHETTFVSDGQLPFQQDHAQRPETRKYNVLLKIVQGPQNHRLWGKHVLSR